MSQTEGLFPALLAGMALPSLLGGGGILGNLFGTGGGGGGSGGSGGSGGQGY